MNETTPDIRTRLEELRLVLRSESMSYGELAELQGLAPHIEAGDVELLEAAGVPEFPDEAPTPKRMTARLGGALILDSTDWGTDGRVTRESFAESFGSIAYVYVDLPNGETLSLFYNDETRLFVADIVKADESGGKEFVRCTVPTA